MSGAQKDGGFVLPYVLVVIAILAIAGTIAAQRLQKANNAVMDMQERARAERLLASAEAAATYAYLTGNPVAGGYDLSPQSLIVSEFGFFSADGGRFLGAAEADSVIADIWAGNGELRRYDLGSKDEDAQETETQSAFVSFQDLTGLPSLNQASPALLLPILESAGAERSEARKLITLLRDYTDSDDRRRPGGAEAADYRIQERGLPPSNSPLRSFSELGNIIGWDEALPSLDRELLMDMTTTALTEGYREQFSTPLQRSLIGITREADSQNSGLDVMQQIELNNRSSSSQARFTLWAPRSDGRYSKRVIEIEHASGGVGQPYTRRFVYDSTVLESDLEKNTVSSDERSDELKLDELNHVVHAASLRP